MKLGEHVELRLSTPDPSRAAAIYERLGFSRWTRGEPLGLSDGRLNLLLEPGEDHPPILQYRAKDPAAVRRVLQDAGVPVSGDEARIGIEPPGGPAVAIVARGDLPPQAGLGESRARCGRFGEFSRPTADLRKAVEFWERLGFARVEGEDHQPYPWRVVSDGGILLGFHQNPQLSGGCLSYFAKDMPDRVDRLRADGLPITVRQADKNGRARESVLEAPGGLSIVMFRGEVP